MNINIAVIQMELELGAMRSVRTALGAILPKSAFLKGIFGQNTDATLLVVSIFKDLQELADILDDKIHHIKGIRNTRTLLGVGEEAAYNALNSKKRFVTFCLCTQKNENYDVRSKMGSIMSGEKIEPIFSVAIDADKLFLIFDIDKENMSLNIEQNTKVTKLFSKEGFFVVYSHCP